MKDLGWASLPPAGDPALAEWLEGASCGPHVKALAVRAAHAARDRRAVLREEQGLGLCNITKCCTEVCPAGIKITDNAISPMKERSAGQRNDPLGRVLRSWRRREDRPPEG